MTLKLTLIFAILGAVAALYALADAVQDETDRVELATTDVAVPKMLTFDRFKQIFHKTYGSFLEEASRKMLYMGRVFLTYMSSISYKHNKTSSYLAVNQMSDWTDEEFENTLINENKLRERELAHGDGEMPLELLDLPEQQVGNDKIRGYYYDDDGQLKSVEMEDTHPRAGDSSSRRHKRDIFGGFFKPKEVEIFHDYRTWRPSSGTSKSCLQPVKNQGRCGSCYIFSVVGLYEWMHCASTGRPVAFSEQFVLDCAEFDEDGCQGGFALSVASFVGSSGVESHANYPYEGITQQCPAEDNDKLALGHFRRPQLVKVASRSLGEMLDRGPVVMSLKVPRFFVIYGGGVDSGRECRDDNTHSMLLVGDGRENGQEYWLFRNSYTSFWGEAGYYRISKDSDCLYNYAIAPFDYFRPHDVAGLFEFRENPEYDPSIAENIRAQRASNRTMLSRVYRRLTGYVN